MSMAGKTTMVRKASCGSVKRALVLTLEYASGRRSIRCDNNCYCILVDCVDCVFDRLPLAAVIDNDIFCVHGGIPRPTPGSTGNRIEDILMVPPVAGISPFYAHEGEETVRVASECLWSDPAKTVNEGNLDPDGYGCSPRGAGAVCFGSHAVDQHGYSYIVRAHEAHSEGVSLSKGARVFTVFSTSKDHNQGRTAMAGCILVDNDEIQIINRSPKCHCYQRFYHDQYCY
eukprot:2078-Heterococcus_DN1.PRE.1